MMLSTLSPQSIRPEAYLTQGNCCR